jgi:hypothetical protein
MMGKYVHCIELFMHLIMEVLSCLLSVSAFTTEREVMMTVAMITYITTLYEDVHLLGPLEQWDCGFTSHLHLGCLCFLCCYVTIVA